MDSCISSSIPLFSSLFPHLCRSSRHLLGARSVPGLPSLSGLQRLARDGVKAKPTLTQGGKAPSGPNRGSPGPQNLKGPQGSGGLPLVLDQWISSIPICCDLETGPHGVRVTTGTSVRSLLQHLDRNAWSGGAYGQEVRGWL